MIRSVMWDLDGTVLDSRPGIYRSIAYALDALSLPLPSEAELLGFLGPPIDVGFSTVCHVPDEYVAEAIRLYREYYTQSGMLEATVYSGVREALCQQRTGGIRTFITTSKPQVYARRIAEHFGVDALFDGIYGAELDGTRAHKADVVRYCIEKHSLNKDACVLVGDRCYDVHGAAQVGIPCIGVLYGYGDRKELTEAGVTAVVDSPCALWTTINSL